MRRGLVGVVVGLLGVALLASASKTAAAADSADECVAVTKTEQSDGLDFELKNNCDKRLSCTIGWTVSCENASGETTSTAKGGASFAVAKDAAHHALGSAKVCRDAWRIDDVTWSCAPAQ